MIKSTEIVIYSETVVGLTSVERVLIFATGIVTSLSNVEQFLGKKPKHWKYLI